MKTAALVRAIDIGYGNTKFTIDDRGGCDLFPSLAVPPDASPLGSQLLTTRRTCRVLVDGQEYEVGPDTTLFSETPILHQDYIDTPQYKALFYAALSAIEVPRIDLLVTGLPVHLLASRSTRLRERLEGIHRVRADHAMEIRQVAVVAQPLGGFIAHAHQSGFGHHMRGRANLLIDPGFRTFDWMVARGLQEVPHLSGSIDCGVCDYLKKIEEAFSSDLNTSYSNLKKTDEGLRLGAFRYRGQPIDLTRYQLAATSVIERAMRELRNRVGGGDDIDAIFLVGGGADYFRAAIREQYPRHPLTTVENPVFANVRGFQLLGQTIAQSKTA